MFVRVGIVTSEHSGSLMMEHGQFQMILGHISSGLFTEIQENG